MSKHTPGPWVLSDVDTAHMMFDGLFARPVFAFHGGKGDKHPAMAYGSAETVEANARLIAAAPDLLAELIEALEVIQDYAAENGDSPACIGTIYAAIAKATGGEA